MNGVLIVEHAQPLTPRTKENLLIIKRGNHIMKSDFDRPLAGMRVLVCGKGGSGKQYRGAGHEFRTSVHD